MASSILLIARTHGACPESRTAHVGTAPTHPKWAKAFSVFQNHLKNSALESAFFSQVMTIYKTGHVRHGWCNWWCMQAAVQPHRHTRHPHTAMRKTRTRAALVGLIFTFSFHKAEVTTAHGQTTSESIPKQGRGAASAVASGRQHAPSDLATCSSATEVDFNATRTFRRFPEPNLVPWPASVKASAA